MRANSLSALLLLAASFALGANVSAHRRDEYLQAARIAVDADQVQLELSLTPGIAVADRVVAAIDADGNGVLSANEQQAYIDRVLGAIDLHIDDATPMSLDASAVTFPAVNALLSGEAAITIHAEAALPALGAGAHHVVFRNRNSSADTVFLANALVPADERIAITGQRRDGEQRDLTIDFVVRQTSAWPALPAQPAAPASQWIWLAVASTILAAVSVSRRAFTSAQSSWAPQIRRT